jgi:hypothetical protein
VGFSVYISQLDVGLLSRLPETLPEFSHRSVGRPHSEKVREGTGIRVLWPWAEHGRARKIISRSGARRRYVVPCFRGRDREAHGEAEEEALAAVILDACAGVEFQEQPAEIEFEWRGERTIHFPDLLVVHGTQAEFWECKRDYEATDLAVRRRSDRLQELLWPLGFGYRLVTTSQLRRAAYYTNAIELRRHAKDLVANPDWYSGLRISPSTAGTANAVMRHVPPQHRSAAIAALLYNGAIVADLSRALTTNATVRAPSSTEGDTPWVLQLFAKSS